MVYACKIIYYDGRVITSKRTWYINEFIRKF